MGAQEKEAGGSSGGLSPADLLDLGLTQHWDRLRLVLFNQKDLGARMQKMVWKLSAIYVSLLCLGEFKTISVSQTRKFAVVSCFHGCIIIGKVHTQVLCIPLIRHCAAHFRYFNLAVPTIQV